MRKLLIAALLASLLLGAVGHATAQGIENPNCYAYDSFPTGWTVLYGTQTTIGGVEAIVGDAGFQSIYGAAVGAYVKLDLPYTARVYSINVSYYYAGDGDAYPGVLKIIPYKDNLGVGDYGRSISPFPQWFVFGNVIFGNVADTLTVSISHATAGAHPDNVVALRVNNICLVPEVLPTPTPNLFASPSATMTPSITLTPTETLTETPITETPTPSLTPTDTTTPATEAPTSTATFDMTLVSGPFYTPKPPSDECTDILNPCPILPVPNWGPINLPSPTAIAILGVATGTPMATYTLYPPYSTLVNEYDLRPLASKAAEVNSAAEAVGTLVLYDIEGTPVSDLVNSVQQMGQTMAVPFSILRSMQEADIGRWWGLFVFLLLLLAFNILVRIVTFFIPIVMAILRLILQIISAIANVIKAFIGLGVGA